MTDTYTVAAGDTLSAIAARNGTTVAELAKLNHISDPNRIAVGEVLHLPDNNASTPDALPGFVVRLVDALSQPITGADLTIESDGQSHDATTDGAGCATFATCNTPTESLKVSIKKAKTADTSKKTIFTHEGNLAASGIHAVTLRSGQVHLTKDARPHQGPPKPMPKEIKEPMGTVKSTRDPAGHPVEVAKVGECPNKLGLKLGTNAKYHDDIVFAANRAGIKPQAIAALIDAEAAPEPVYVVIPGPNGKSRRVRVPGVTQWNPNSAAGSSSAAGLTQFLDGTWLQCCLTPGYYIHDQSVAKGWVEAAPAPSHHAHATKAEPTHYVFKLASGHTTTEPWKHLGDTNVQACLKMRDTPRWAITAAADYGKLNLDYLTKHYPKIASQDDSGKAKFMYLAHHEGPGGALLVISDKLDETHVSERQKKAGVTAADVVKAKLITQVGATQATARLKKLPDPGNAYRFWITAYVDGKISLFNFSCPNVAKHAKLTMANKDSGLSLLCAVGGPVVVNPPKTEKH